MVKIAIDKDGISRWLANRDELTTKTYKAIDYFEQALEMEKQAILDFLPEDVPGSCIDCDSCNNPCKQLQKTL